MRKPTNWDDLRYFLAVARTGSLTAAGRDLSVDPSTVGRRIGALEDAFGIRLFERRPDGYPLTDDGHKLLAQAERVEVEVAGLDRALEIHDQPLTGTVTLTAAEPIIASFVLPSLPALRELHPAIRIDLVSDYRILSHTRREVDIALRTAQPDEDGLLARRIAAMGFGLYASAQYIQRAGTPSSLDDIPNHSLIGWRDQYPKVPPIVWFHKVIANNHCVVRVNGGRDRATAVQLGLGIALLPFMTARDYSVQQILPSVTIPTLDVWLMAHPETARIARVRRVMDFLANRAYQEKDVFTLPAEKARL